MRCKKKGWGAKKVEVQKKGWGVKKNTTNNTFKSANNTFNNANEEDYALVEDEDLPF